MTGVDISHYQTVTDFAALVKAAEFVILKATEGTAYQDPTYRSRVAALRAHGARVGSYHFARDGAALVEADAYIAFAQPKPGDIVALDVEAGILLRLPAQQLVTWCKQWLDHVRSRTGITPLIYMSASVVNDRDWSSVAATYPLWLAAYQASMPATKWWTRPAIWQHTPSGRIDGITGDVDLDTPIAVPAATTTATQETDMPLTDADIDKVATATVTKLLGTPIATVDAAQINPKNPTGAWTYTVRELWARLIRLAGLDQANTR